MKLDTSGTTYNGTRPEARPSLDGVDELLNQGMKAIEYVQDDFLVDFIDTKTKKKIYLLDLLALKQALLHPKGYTKTLREMVKAKRKNQ